MFTKSTIFALSLFLLVGCTASPPAENTASTPNSTETQPSEQPSKEAEENSGQDLTGLNLTIPTGFKISKFAENLSDSRDMVIDGLGNMWVSRNGTGKISQIEIKDGKAVATNDIFRGLNNPHGLAFDPEDQNFLYFAEEDKISRVHLYTEESPQKIADLPSGGRHTTRSLLFGEDGRLYVSIGSTCDVCVEKNPMHGAIYVMNKDGSGLELFANGLRNAVFMTRQPSTDFIWATEMGRDFLGDDLPPDEVNRIEANKNYGWPMCYGKNIKDLKFNPGLENTTACLEPFETPSAIDLPAHSAPLGLAFFSNEGWPKEYQGDLLVAYHGSWNRSERTGYKVVRFDFDTDGTPVQNVNGNINNQDFITGWLTSSGGVSGRPVGILFDDSALYISDDEEGVIYKIEPKI